MCCKHNKYNTQLYLNLLSHTPHLRLQREKRLVDKKSNPLRMQSIENLKF